MAQSTEMSLIVSMLFRTFLNLFKLIMEIFHNLVCLLAILMHTDSVGTVFVFAQLYLCFASSYS